MKYNIILLIICITCSTAYGSGDKYVDALRNCSQYSETGNLSVDGLQVTSKKQIFGWIDGKCKYKETINMNGINADILCNFTKPQIKEIVSVADAYYYTLKYSGEMPDTSSLESAKNNPISNVFNKYIQDQSVCSIGGF